MAAGFASSKNPAPPRCCGLFPREKQELPMQIVMLARGSDTSSPKGASDAFRRLMQIPRNVG